MARNRDFGRDMFNSMIGICWQTAITAVGIYLVIQDYLGLAVSIGVIAVTTVVLKFNWLDKLRDYPQDLPPSGTLPSEP